MAKPALQVAAATDAQLSPPGRQRVDRSRRLPHCQGGSCRMIPAPDYRRTDPHGNAAQSLYAADAIAGKFDPEKCRDTFTPPTLSPAGRHFVELARCDDSATASRGEKAAHHLAHRVLAHVQYLDDEALAGMCEFAMLAAADPQTMRAMLTQEVSR